MSSRTQLHAHHVPLAVLVLLAAAAPLLAGAPPSSPDPAANACANPSVDGACHNVPKALRLKLIAIPTILVASVIGVCLPLFSRSVPALRPDHNLFVIVKAFASGVILATGYMNVLPDSFNNLTSPCLPKKRRGEVRLLKESGSTCMYPVAKMTPDAKALTMTKRLWSGQSAGTEREKSGRHTPITLATRIIGMAISFRRSALGTLWHAPSTEGLTQAAVAASGDAGCAPAMTKGHKTSVAIGQDLVVVTTWRLVGIGLLNAASARLLHYMALVDLLAADFMGPKLQDSVRLQLVSFAAVLLGAGGMSVMAKWA
ncbi:fe(2+) transport protein 1-like [Panicum hallii]|uniref:fe(2+) transport protein 1-like n=1 Tax=Panicum hallii TaxID=206008 RepID=UPI000DF4DC07|nr:fe(2+) transport protein 1-like [Panicum hallii]